MLGQSNHLNLPRKVTLFYWLSFAASLTAVLGGLLVIVWQQRREEVEATCLSHLQRAVTALELQLTRQVPDPCGPTISELRRVGRFQYGGVISPNGRCLAHTDQTRIGRRAVEPEGRPIQGLDDPSVLGLRWKQPDGTVLREYRKPIGDDGAGGQLRLAIREPSLWESARPWRLQAPTIVLVPLLIGLLGASLIRHVLKPLAPIDRQLAAAAASSEILGTEFLGVPCRNAASLGWNRIVQHIEQLRGQRPLEELLDRRIQSRRSSDLEKVLSSLRDGVAVTDGDHNIQLCNPAFGVLLAENSSPEELENKPLRTLLADENDRRSWEQLTDPASARRVVVAEVTRKQGSEERSLRLAKHPLGAIENDGYVWTARDVTQQKLADQMRDQFLDSATHELRTPLANIKAYAETLAVLDEVDDRQQKELCNTIDSEVTRLARFIDELLDISSLEAGSLTIQRKNTDLARLLPELLEKVRRLVLKKGIQFESKLPEKLPEVAMDKDKVATALVNLLGNAVKYTPQGGFVRFQVQIAKDRLEFTIEDTGVGIPAGEQDHVFDKFFRGSDARVQAETGTGLGLALAKQVFELHGGSLSVTSEVDKGSRFVARLPMVTAQYCGSTD